jgi:hypothetical protein
MKQERAYLISATAGKYSMYIKRVDGLYYVYLNQWLLYGGYKQIGTASQKIAKVANGCQKYYATKTEIEKGGK